MNDTQMSMFSLPPSPLTLPSCRDIKKVSMDESKQMFMKCYYSNDKIKTITFRQYKTYLAVIILTSRAGKDTGTGWMQNVLTIA